MTSTGTPTYMPSPTAATSTTPPASDLHISSTRRVSAPKDRQCRFCGQWFTASSLGRHYDQWVKPVNPKPPDGIHDVTLIAQMRGTITRRTRNRDKKGVGTALGLREEGGEKNAEGGSGGTTSSDGLEAGQKKTGGDGVEKLEGVTRVQKKVEELMGIRFNHIPWYISGVMKDLPPQHTPPASGLAQDSSSAQTGSSPGEASKQDGLVVALEERQKKVAEDLENGRAAELALTDILGSVQEARYVKLKTGDSIRDKSDILDFNLVYVFLVNPSLTSIYLRITFQAYAFSYFPPLQLFTAPRRSLPQVVGPFSHPAKANSLPSMPPFKNGLLRFQH